MLSPPMVVVFQLFVVLLSTTPTLADYDAAPTVNIESGQLIGKTVSLPNALGPVNQFLGVPFAAPPQRFLPPQRANAFTGPLDATAFKPACIQQFQCKRCFSLVYIDYM